MYHESDNTLTKEAIPAAPNITAPELPVPDPLGLEFPAIYNVAAVAPVLLPILQVKFHGFIITIVVPTGNGTDEFDGIIITPLLAAEDGVAV